MPLLGVGPRNGLNRAICDLIASSKIQLTICTPYFNLPVAVTREINRALKRGVNVSISSSATRRPTTFSSTRTNRSR